MRKVSTSGPYAPIRTSTPRITDEHRMEARTIGQRALEVARTTNVTRGAEFSVDYPATTDKTTLAATLAHEYGPAYNEQPTLIEFISTDGNTHWFSVP